MHTSTNTLHTCKNCNLSFTGNYCSNCGEKVYTSHDKSILHFLEEGLHFITHFEGSFLTTLKTIFVTPGKLSTDYSNGIRKRYFKPLSFFLTLVVLYLLFPLLSGLNMPLVYHVHQFPYSGMAQQWVQHYLGTHSGTTMEQLSELFAVKSEKTSKLMLFIIIPLGALPLWLFFKKQRPYFFDSLIFSTEFNSFFLITQFFIVPLLLIIYHWLAQLFSIPFFDSEGVMAGIEILMLVWFLQKALKRFVTISRWKSVLINIVVLVWHTISVYFIYKFLLFVLVSMLVH